MKHQSKLLKALIICFFVALMPQVVNAKTDQLWVNGLHYFIDTKYKYAKVIPYSDDNYYHLKGEIVIPDSVTYDKKSYPVLYIDEKTFYKTYGITSVIIPNSVITIGSYAFFDCDDLVTVTIPNSVTKIGEKAFYDCRSLTSVTIGNSRKSISIGYEAFAHCFKLTSVTIGNSVTSIPERCFENCCGLTSVTIPNSVTEIGRDAFAGCTALTSITIPNSVTKIGIYAFFDCAGLTSVTIPESVTLIGDEAFGGCSGLTTVYCYINDPSVFKCQPFVNNVTIRVPAESVDLYKTAWKESIILGIGESADRLGKDLSFKIDGFYYKVNKDGKSVSLQGCYENKKMTGDLIIPETVTCDGLICKVTNIGFKAFYDCKSLISVDIPYSVTEIGSCAFMNCASLTSVTISNSVTSIGDRAFSRCSSLTTVTIPNSMLEIGSEAFYLCSGLTSITIGNSLKSIGYNAFYMCDNLKIVNVNDITTVFKIKGDNPLRRAHNLYLNGQKVTKLVIPNSVTKIPESLFSGCESITSVNIPNSVTSIGENAFYNCKGLTSLAIPNSVTEIGERAFQNCTGLTSVTIGNSVTEIGQSTFSGCGGLTSLTLGNSLTSIKYAAFSDCKNVLIKYNGSKTLTKLGWKRESRNDLSGRAPTVQEINSVGKANFNKLKKGIITRGMSFNTIDKYNDLANKYYGDLLYDCMSIDTFRRERTVNNTSYYTIGFEGGYDYDIIVRNGVVTSVSY